MSRRKTKDGRNGFRCALLKIGRGKGKEPELLYPQTDDAMERGHKMGFLKCVRPKKGIEAQARQTWGLKTPRTPRYGRNGNDCGPKRLIT